MKKEGKEISHKEYNANQQKKEIITKIKEKGPQKFNFASNETGESTDHFS